MRLLACALLFSLLVFSACSSDDPVAPSGASLQDLDGILEHAGHLDPLAGEQNEVTDTWTEEDNGYEYTYEVHDVVDNIESIAYLGLNDDVIWTGSLIQGKDAHDFVYVPIAVRRAPITLSISLESSQTTGDLSLVVDDPKLSSVRQGISDLIAQSVGPGTHVPARVEFTHEQIYSASQMSLFVGADVRYGVGSLNTQFNWESTTRKTKIMAKYMQIYYSVDMDTPTSPRALFPGDASINEFKAAFPKGSMPLYVSSVSYGFMALMCIETEFKAEEMGLALEAAYSGVVDVELDFGYTAQEVMESSSVKIIVYGGSTAGLDQIENGFEGFMKVVEASQDFTPESPGVPLVYRFRHVRDNTLALVTLTSQYTLVRPVQLTQFVRVNSERFVAISVDDEGPDNAVDMDRFFVYANAFNCSAPGKSCEQFNPENQEVFGWSSPGWVEMGDGHTTIFDAVGSIELGYNCVDYNFQNAKLELKAFCRDYDGGWSADETAWGTITLIGNDIWGPHEIHLYSSDFHFRCDVNVSPGN